MSGAISAAASGVSAGMTWLDATAGNIANAQTPGYSPVSPTFSSQPGTAGVAVATASGGTADLSAQLPDLMLSALMVKANIASMRVAADTWRAAMSA